MKRNNFKLSLIISALFLTFSGYSILSCSSNSDDTGSEMMEEEEEEPEENNCTAGKQYVEKDGVVRVDIENTSPIANGWTTAKTISGFVGPDYLIWTGPDNFNNPGQGIIRFSIKIVNPGTYRFVWNSRIGTGTSISEHNDSWLRIKGDDFYGEKSGGSRVYPKGSGKTPNPEGSSGDGWLKVYMNNLNQWFWRSSTSDNDPHDVFAVFNTAGTYDVEISGRSKSHAIDQFVLFKTDKTLSEAQNAALSEITCK